MYAITLVISLVAVGFCYCDAKMNVLFLVSDDMRPELSSFLGPDFPSPIHPRMHSPHLDKLASKSLLLKRAYVQQAVCSPSRTSLLTGRRPDTTHVYDLVKYFRTVGGNFTTIPEYFKDNGYHTVGMGKIFHPGHASNNDDPPSWTDPYWHAPNLQYWGTRKSSWIAVPRQEREDKPLPDEQIARHAIETMKKLAMNPDKPFFLAVGFHKPHLPFIFPEEFLEYYPLEDIQVPDNGYAPVNMPKIAWSNYGELRDYQDIAKLNASGDINTSLPNAVVRDLRRAYYSALSYTDSLIGDLLRTLQELGLESNTIVSFWGDHGWQLGEHGEWCKHTNFELATHAPMMVHVPGLTNEGIVFEGLTEYVDLFPTLADAAGLPSLELCPEDSSKIKLCTEGLSLIPLMKRKESRWKDRVFSQYPRPGNHMGYTMRTNQFRYTEWVEFSGEPQYKPIWDKVAGIELYDHRMDPEENYNVFDKPDYSDVRRELSKKLREGWRSALPKDRKYNKQMKYLGDDKENEILML